VEQVTPNLGQPPGPDARRDAVHIAVAPVVAAEAMPPGMHVTLDGEGHAIDPGLGKSIGIVDPFRKEWVDVGETFWLFLYPNTVTHIRHAWNHPAFRIKIPGVG